ncbi:MAG: cytochrome c biogenesis protein CcdA [Planctomycetota bacterium]|jgi:cytochrome c biogenesis protein CcdA
MESRLSWFMFLLASLLAPLTAQDDPKFSLAAKFEPAAAKPGDSVKLVLTATTAHGWHAYGTMETGNIPVSLDTSALKLTGLELDGKVKIPPGNPEFTPIGETFPLGTIFEVEIPLKVAVGAKVMKISGELGYQICMQGRCEQPSAAAFVAELKAGGGGGAAPATQEPKPVPVSGLGVKPGLKLEPEEIEPEEDGKVTIRATFDPPTVRAGEVTTLILDVHVIDHEWHAYGTLEGEKENGNTPVTFDHLVQDFGDLEFEGDALIPEGDEAETPIGPIYPLPHKFQVRQHVRVPAGAEPGTIDITAVIGYQICDANGCQTPTEGDADGQLIVEAGEARAELLQVPEHKIETPAAGAVDGGVNEGKGDDEEVDPDDPFASWWALILASIGGGLFALAMPCTYPMIPITFSFFTKQAEKRGGNVMMLSLVYGLGIVGMFVFVGVGLSAVIIDVVNHWLTNTIIGFMFFFFACVLFGWINLNPPQWMNKMAYKAQSTAGSGNGLIGGLAGVFFMGATLVLTSFTCTAPIVGSLIGSIAKHGTLKVAVGMGIFGLTMAIPFMLLSLMPTKVKAMPKSGDWMETLKISLGYVELAAAFKFVSMVDIALGWDALPRELFLMVWAAIFGMWALYLFGVLRKAGTPAMGVGSGRMAGGMIVTLLATYFLFGAMGNRMDAIMTGFVPAYSNRIVMKGEGGGQPAMTHKVVKDDPEGAIEVAKAEGKLLLYNITGFN